MMVDHWLDFNKIAYLVSVFHTHVGKCNKLRLMDFRHLVLKCIDLWFMKDDCKGVDCSVHHSATFK